MKMLKNQEIRTHAKINGVRLYEIADALFISEPTMTSKLRHELKQDEKDRIFKIIDEIAERKAAARAEAV